MLLRILIGDNDRHHSKPLYEAIVMTARQIQMAGAAAGFIRLEFSAYQGSEMVDSRERVDQFLPMLDGMMSSGLVTLEKVQVLPYGEPLHE
jgi:PII-like signaling protein